MCEFMPSSTRESVANGHWLKLRLCPTEDKEAR